MLSTCAQAAANVLCYPEAKLVVVSGTTEKADIRKPVTLSIIDGADCDVYNAQKRAYNGEFEFRVPFTLIDAVEDYTVKLNINGKYEELPLEKGDKFTADSSWNAVNKVLTISGLFVYKGYATSDEVTVTVTDADANDEVVYTDSCAVNDRYEYQIEVDFTDFDFSDYEISVTTKKDLLEIPFAYKDIDSIIAEIKEDGATAEFVQTTLVNDIKILDMVTWTAVDGSTIDELSEDVFAILLADIANVENTDDLKLALNKAVFTDALNKAVSGEEVLDIADTLCGTFFDIKKLIAYPKYEAFSKANDKFKPLGDVAGATIKAYSEVEKAFNDSILLYAVNSSGNWSQIQELAFTYKDYLGLKEELNMDACTELFDNKEYDTIELFAQKAQELEAESDQENGEEEEEEETPTRGPSGGGFSPSKIVNDNPPTVVAPQQMPVIFDDIANAAWAETAITELYKKGIVNGVADKKFDPNSPVTREQFVKMLMIAFNITENGEGNAEFSDVDYLRDWFASYVKLAATNGIVTGKGDGTFGVGEAITRQDAATLIYRLVTVAEGEEIATANFADASRISDYAKEAVNYLCAKNVINGVGNGNFEPTTICSRAQAAKIIYQVLAIK